MFLVRGRRAVEAVSLEWVMMLIRGGPRVVEGVAVMVVHAIRLLSMVSTTTDRGWMLRRCSMAAVAAAVGSGDVAAVVDSHDAAAAVAVRCLAI
jgi:hypothetical protein